MTHDHHQHQHHVDPPKQLQILKKNTPIGAVIVQSNKLNVQATQ